MTTAWGRYVKTNVAGFGNTLLQVSVEGQNYFWHGVFSINGTSALTPNITWNNAQLLSYSCYNAATEDVQAIIMSNTPADWYGGTEIVFKLGRAGLGAATITVVAIGGQYANNLDLSDSEAPPFAHTMVTSEGTYNIWTVKNNVGIGTLTPTEKLDVAGNVRAHRFTIKDSWDNFLSSEDNGNTHHLIGTYRGWESKAVYVAGYNVSNNPAYATERVYIGHPDADKYMVVNFLNGGVGIGTTKTGDPNFRLFVEKGIRTRKVKVDQVTPWPDYVFEPTYKLPTLHEVEAFIKANKHLPDVLSANEVEKNGLDLGENQAMLLKKIEEQMLYIIQQQKEIDKLKEENKEFKMMATEVEQLKYILNKLVEQTNSIQKK